MTTETTDILLDIRHELSTKADNANRRWSYTTDERERVGALAVENALRDTIKLIDIHLRALVGSGT
jgi:hypothetical protein